MRSDLNTFAGMLAVIIWSTSIPLTRSLAEKVGMFTAASSIFLLSGIISIAFYVGMKRSNFRKLMEISPKYIFTAGSCFVLYMLCLYCAVGLAATRAQVVEVSLLNYLWPVTTLIFSIPIAGNRVRPFYLAAGIIISFTGVIWASIAVNKIDLSLSGTLHELRSNLPAYLLASAAAVLWGLYSNLVRYFQKLGNRMSVPLFFLISGAALWLAGFFFPEKSAWNGTALAELSVIVFLPGIVGYLLWDIAVRKGNFILVASFSYLAPLFSTIVIGLYLGVKLETGVWIASILVIAGAVISRFSILNPGPQPAARGKTAGPPVPGRGAAA